MGHGRVFALYVALYTLGRAFIESLRVDPAPVLAGLRWNDWVSIVVGLGAIAYLIVSARSRPGREDPALADPGTGPRAEVPRRASGGQDGPHEPRRDPSRPS